MLRFFSGLPLRELGKVTDGQRFWPARVVDDGPWVAVAILSSDAPRRHAPTDFHSQIWALVAPAAELAGRRHECEHSEYAPHLVSLQVMMNAIAKKAARGVRFSSSIPSL